MRVLGVLLAVVLAAAATAGGATAPTATVTSTIVGLNDTASGGYAPPDVQVAAGPGWLVQTVNLAARIWSTSSPTPQLARTIPLGTLFSSGNDQLTDPRILYDAPTGRWLASISDEPGNSVLLAVSKTSDPTGQWTVRSFAASGCADQPRLGVADAVVVIAADIFASCGEGGPAPVLGGELWVINKQQLLAASAVPASITYGPDDQYSSFAPAQSLSSTSTEYVVSVDSPSSRVVHLFAIDGVPPAAVSVHQIAALPLSPLQEPPSAKQPDAPGAGVTPAITTNDNRVLDSVWEKGKLWLSANSGCTPIGDSFLRSCARVTELSTAGAPAVDWDTDLGFPGASLFFPAIRPDASGNLVIVVGESSPTILPELLALGRTPDGTFTAPVLVGQGVGPSLSFRYGDYFGAARDPGNPNVVWVTGQDGSDVRGGHGWGTTIGAVQVTPAGATPPTVTTRVPPRVRAAAGTAMAGTPVRLAYRALDDGSRVKELVVVKRKGAIVFQATTATGTLHANQIYFVVWHPGRKLHGAFRFCVRAVATGGAKSPETCATVMLR
ncbi:MAG: hypothetical protein ACYDCH_03425 [Gaiellaceae bacterium]